MKKPNYRYELINSSSLSAKRLEKTVKRETAAQEQVTCTLDQKIPRLHTHVHILAIVFFWVIYVQFSSCSLART